MQIAAGHSRWGFVVVRMACCLIIWVASQAMGQAGEVEFLESQYIVDVWQTEQGLPDNFITAIRQTPDGYIWVATFNGLARFNGVEFVIFDAANTPGLPTSRIINLYVDGKGRLWVRSEYGHLSYWTEGGFKAVAGSRQLPIGRKSFWHEDDAGGIWMAGLFGPTNMYYLRDGRVFLTNSVVNLERAFRRVADIEGNSWFEENGSLFHFGPNETVKYSLPEGTSLTRLKATENGGIWQFSSQVHKFEKGHWEDYGPLPMNTDQLGDIAEDKSGNLWIGTGHGELWTLGTNRVFSRFKSQKSTASELGRSILEDAEGNLWLGTGGYGLLRLKPMVLKTYDSRDGLASDVVRSITEDLDGRIWLTTVQSVEWLGAGEGRFRQRELAENDLPWGIYGDRKGAVWVGSLGKGLWRLQGENVEWFQELDRRELDVFGPAINVLFEDRKGKMHLGSPEGWYEIGRGKLAKSRGPEGIEKMDIRAMAQDEKDSLYFALNGEGLVRKQGERWDRFTTRDGLPVNHVWSLHFDDEKTLWIGTHGGGLSRFRNGQFFNFREANLGLPRLITCILEDDLGHLWFGSSQGLFSAGRAELNAFADGRTAFVAIKHFDRADGMGSSQCTPDRQPTAWKARDGRLWFATMKGVTVVDPRSLPVNSRRPPVVIEGVLIDDKIAPIATRTENAKGPLEVEIKPGARRLEFRYAGLSFTAPEKVRFQYRLEGFESGWVQAGARRAAYYTKVPPGTYQFQVVACNNDNLWNKTGASLAVVVLPHFWQTTWFMALAIVSGGGLILGTYEWRMKQLRRERAIHETFSRRLIESQEVERKRMAAELHDSLGQNLLVVKNYALMGLKETATPEKMRSQLREISETTSASIDEVRSIARALRPYQLDRFGLTKTLEDAAELLAKTDNLKVAAEIDNVDGTFSPEGEISVYRVIQECFNNIIKHAEASCVILRVRKEGNLVRMILEDNGRGFDYAAVLSRSGTLASFGLSNLRERVRLLGGNLKIETSPGQGTRVVIEIRCDR